MLVLRSSPASPFGRKVKIAARLLGVMQRIEIVPANPNDADDPLRLQNPLGKIPVLVLEDGSTVYDSRVIVEYLDMLAGGGRVVPASGSARIAALTLNALADGIMDAALLRRYEILMRAENERSAQWIEHQTGKMERGLEHLEANPPKADDTTIGGIAVACMLGYLDFRFAGEWRASHPRLVDWLARFDSAVPAFAATAPPAA